jgi:predicted AAA+ superfamily ATPase
VYHRQLIREDIRDATAIKRIDDIEILSSLLPSKVGAPLSVESLARDLQVSHNSIHHWLEAFETLFLLFRIPPWTQKIARTITKEKTLSLLDYTTIPSPAARFENMVALELLRAISNWNDLGRGNFSLHYIRNKEKEEVDFVIANDHMPLLLVEAKLSETNVSPSLLKFQTRLKVPAVQLIDHSNVYRIMSNAKQRLLVASASRWLAGLP